MTKTSQAKLGKLALHKRGKQRNSFSTLRLFVAKSKPREGELSCK